MKETFAIEPGDGQQLGANFDGKGVNFALFSAHAERVELCLFDPCGKTEIARLELPEYTRNLARLRTRSAARSLIRLSGLWAVRSGERPSL